MLYTYIYIYIYIYIFVYNIYIIYIYIYIHIHQRIIFVLQLAPSNIKNWKNTNFKISVTLWFTLNSFMLWFACHFKHLKHKYLLRNPWRICSFIIDLKVKNSSSHKVKQTNWLKTNRGCNLLRRKVEIKQAKVCVIHCP